MTTKDMYRALTGAGINVIRVGLKSTDIINSDSSAIGAGSYHPAFRQLVEGELAKEDMEKAMSELLERLEDQQNAPDSLRAQPSGEHDAVRVSGYMKTIIFSSAPESFSNMIGNKKSNRIYFEQKYPYLRFRFKVDKTLPRGRYSAALL